MTLIPELVSRLRPGLVLGAPQKTLGQPTDGKKQLMANTKYYRDLEEFLDFGQCRIQRDLSSGLASNRRWRSWAN